MFAFTALSASILAFSAHVLAIPTTPHRDSYVSWRNFRANGVNLGGWLCQEATIDPYFWGTYCNGTADEWNCCARLGDKCASVFEERYATYTTRDDVDKLASGGVNLLRIPTTYAAWIKVPGAQYHSGNQQSHIKRIASYAIKKYGMHIVLDIHGLPGVINGLDIGERVGKWDWFNNQTNLDLSLKAVDEVLWFIQRSGSPQSYTLAPINEPTDNPDFSKFGTPAALSDDGAAWVQRYIDAIIEHTKVVNPKIPIMFQGSFKGEPFWSGNFAASTNIIFDVHNYYFGRPSDSDNVTTSICADAKRLAGDGKFPVFVGEWAIQTLSNNKFANRFKNLNTGLYAYNKYTQGNAYWTAKYFGNVSVAGQGVQADYWNYLNFIDMGIIDPAAGRRNCA